MEIGRTETGYFRYRISGAIVCHENLVEIGRARTGYSSYRISDAIVCHEIWWKLAVPLPDISITGYPVQP